MNAPEYITFKVYLQVYGGKHKPLEYQLLINSTTVHLLAKHLNLAFVPEINPTGNVCMAENLEVRPEFRQTFSKAHLRNFLYAILHSSIYQTARKSLFQIDFSRLHFPGKTKDFWRLESLGAILIQLHATGISGNLRLEAGFPAVGSNVIEPSELRFEGESQKLWINKQQYFSNVPAQLWEYKTGGIKPLFLWFEMRSGHNLKSEDMNEFGTLTYYITETIRISQKIDDVLNFYSSADKS